MVLAPEHPLVDALVGASLAGGRRPSLDGRRRHAREAVDAYRRAAGRKSELDRQAEGREKTGVFIGAYATNPVNGESIPVFVADYVLMGYGTGAIMAVPGQDQRDWDFAEAFGLPIVRTVQPPEGWEGEAVHRRGPGHQLRVPRRAGRPRGQGRDHRLARGAGLGTGTVTYKLRDWLFSRQRYWGEPFPIVFDEDDLPIAVPEAELPVLLPELDDYSPRTFAIDDNTSRPGAAARAGRPSGWR